MLQGGPVVIHGVCLDSLLPFFHFNALVRQHAENIQWTSNSTLNAVWIWALKTVCQFYIQVIDVLSLSYILIRLISAEPWNAVQIQRVFKKDWFPF